MVVGLVQSGLCGDHDSALVFNQSANEQHRVAISWFHYTGPHMIYETALFILFLFLTFASL